MPNGTTTKVKTKTSTVVIILLAGGAVAMMGVLLGRETMLGGTTRTPTTITRPGDCAITCAEVAQRCPPAPTPQVVDRPSCEPGPDIVVTRILYDPVKTPDIRVIVSNTGSASAPAGVAIHLSWVGPDEIPYELGIKKTTRALNPNESETLSFPPPPANKPITGFKAKIDTENIINELYRPRPTVTAVTPPCVDGELNNVFEQSLAQ